MGYDLHITRRAEWSNPESGPAITREEFDRVVLADARFRRDEALGPHYAVLDTGPRVGEAPWLCWQNGEITTRNPAPSFVKIAVGVADKLNARVVGDDGEEYDRNGRVRVDENERHDHDAPLEDDPGMAGVESDADMRRRRRRGRTVVILQVSGIAAFLALFVALLGRQVGWW